MSDEKKEGGSEWELSEAIRLMGEAQSSGDPSQVATAMRRHAEALTNVTNTIMIPTLRQVLESVVRSEVGAVRSDIAKLAEQNVRIDTRQQNADTASLSWRTELRIHIDGQFDHFGEELDSFKQETREALAALGGLEARVERVEVGQAKLEIKVESLEAHGAPAKAVDELHQLRGEVSEIRSLLILTRRQLWLTWIPVAAFVLLVVISIIVRGWQ